jgi:hypothetical protein
MNEASVLYEKTAKEWLVQMLGLNGEAKEQTIVAVKDIPECIWHLKGSRR